MKTKISPSFQPSQNCYALIHKHGATMEFADELLPEFIMYWQEAGLVKASWGSTFLNHVKAQWSRKQKKDKETRGTPLTQNTEYESLPEVKLSSKESAKQAIEQMKRKSGLRCRST